MKHLKYVITALVAMYASNAIAQGVSQDITNVSCEARP